MTLVENAYKAAEKLPQACDMCNAVYMYGIEPYSMVF